MTKLTHLYVKEFEIFIRNGVTEIYKKNQLITELKEELNKQQIVNYINFIFY